MKYLLITTLLMACQFMQAQESAEAEESPTFTRSYPFFQLSEDGLDSWQEVKEEQTVFVFNKGADEHVEWIFDGTKNKIYKTSGVKRHSTDDGSLYQAFEGITENGTEVMLFLFDSGTMILYYSEDDEAIRFINPDYLESE